MEANSTGMGRLRLSYMDYKEYEHSSLEALDGHCVPWKCLTSVQPIVRNGNIVNKDITLTERKQWKCQFILFSNAIIVCKYNKMKWISFKYFQLLLF